MQKAKPAVVTLAAHNREVRRLHKAYGIVIDGRDRTIRRLIAELTRKYDRSGHNVTDKINLDNV